MGKYFNVTGACYPDRHYMVDITSRLEKIKEMIVRGDYFAINRGRQYGKTTTLQALANYLKDDFTVLHLDFQKLDSDDFENRKTFVKAFARELWRKYRSIMDKDIADRIKEMKQSLENGLADMFTVLTEWCEISEKPVVLMIDEVDYASNNQVFIDFLAQLRAYYLDRDNIKTFQSVIFAGVHDIRNLKRKIRPDEEHQHNSPWNISANFDIDMSFSADDISGMLKDYEEDHKTGMDICEISQLIYDNTSGYPVLVSTLCKYMDENSSWTNKGFNEAVKDILISDSTLFGSLINKIEDNKNLYDCLYQILIEGRDISYNPDSSTLSLAEMYGFIKNENNKVKISNRIFETRLYNYILMSEEMQATSIFRAGTDDKNQFISGGQLDMEKILEKFIMHFNEIYGDNTEKFKENEGRKIFLLYLRPIINGIGNYYIESQTRDNKRTDIIIDYAGKQYIIELKIWRGDEYNKRGEQQIAGYLDYYHANKGYLMSFNFNKSKKTGVHTIQVGDKTVVEGIV